MHMLGSFVKELHSWWMCFSWQWFSVNWFILIIIRRHFDIWRKKPPFPEIKAVFGVLNNTNQLQVAHRQLSLLSLLQETTANHTAWLDVVALQVTLCKACLFVFLEGRPFQWCLVSWDASDVALSHPVTASWGMTMSDFQCFALIMLGFVICDSVGGPAQGH